MTVSSSSLCHNDDDDLLATDGAESPNQHLAVDPSYAEFEKTNFFPVTQVGPALKEAAAEVHTSAVVIQPTGLSNAAILPAAEICAHAAAVFHSTESLTAAGGRQVPYSCCCDLASRIPRR